MLSIRIEDEVRYNLLQMNPQVKMEVDKFFSKSELLQFKKGETIFRIGEPPPGIFYLVEGVVKRYAVSSKGDELTLNIYKPQSFFPVELAINNTIPGHYFEAMTAVSVKWVDKEEFLKFIKKEPEVLLDLVSRTYRGLDGLFQRMEQMMSGGAQARLIIELLIFARRFGEKYGNNQTQINIQLTENELASQSGIARETVSREMQKLKEKGYLSYENSFITIKNLVKLEELLTSVK